MSEITLRKYHGLGNDYLIYDPNRNDDLLQERQIQALCKRNIGVGADGILYGPFFVGEEMWVRIFNPDGSEAEKSGNGIRIFSRYLKDAGYVKGESYVLHTKAGETRVTFLDDNGDYMRVDMGYPKFVAGEIPAVGFGEEIVNEAIFFGDNFYNATCVSMGNPNCVLMLEEVNKRKALHFASHRLGLVDERVTVHMHGGKLLIEFASDGRIDMTGPVVYIGSITLAEHFFA